MQTLAAIFGVRDWNRGAVGATWHQSFVEHCNLTLGKALDQAYQRGDLMNERGLDMAIANAVAMLNQHNTEADGTSAFHRVTGQRPRTLADIMLTASGQQIEVAVPEDIDQDYVQQLQRYVQDILLLYHSKLERKACAALLLKNIKFLKPTQRSVNSRLAQAPRTMDTSTKLLN